MDWTGGFAAHGVALTIAGVAAVAAVAWILLRRWRPGGRRWPARAVAGILCVVSIAGAGGSLYLLFEVTGVASPQLRPLLGTPAPDVPFTVVGTGETRHLAQYRGQVILLNLWATWCSPCVAEFSQLDRLHANYGDDGLAVVSLTDEDPATVAAFRKRFPVEMLLGSTQGMEIDSQAYDVLSAQGLPLIAVIDRDGVLRHHRSAGRRATSPWRETRSAGFDGLPLTQPEKGTEWSSDCWRRANRRR